MSAFTTTHEYARAGWSFRVACRGWSCGRTADVAPDALLARPDRDVLDLTLRCSACGGTRVETMMVPPGWNWGERPPSAAGLRIAERPKGRLDFIGLAFAIAARRIAEGADTIPAPERARRALNGA